MSNTSHSLTEVGVVVIGRNEGDRLKICLESAVGNAGPVVYVDSGSSDNSREVARDLGVEVVELDMSVPFTAARARNAGYDHLIAANADIHYVQFVDGDCEINADWFQVAYEYLESHDQVAVVSGRRRERYPDATVFNLLCDFDWDSPVGESLYCGGDAMMRVNAFTLVNGFRVDLIAGEEPELCVRLRKAGWKIWRLEAEMTLHDANMTSISQWWKRDMRCGFTYAQGVQELGRECSRERNRVLLWGGLIPLIMLLLMPFIGLKVLYLALVYPLQVLRITFKCGEVSSRNFINALFLTLGKFPEMVGIIKYYFNRAFGITNRLIEYK